MYNEKIDLELIDCYLKNELDIKEIAAVEKRLKDDKDFMELYSFVKSLKDNVRKNVLSNKKHILEDYETQLQKQNISKNTNLRRLFTVASIAAVFLLLVFFVPDMMYFKNKNQVSLDFFETYPAHVLKRSSHQNISKLKQKAYSLYGISDFNKAAPLLAELCDSGDKESCFYAGVSLLGSGQVKKALSFFNVDGLSIDKNTINWYKGLCYWNLNKKSEAQSFWSEVNDSTPYYNKIKNILKDEQQ